MFHLVFVTSQALNGTVAVCNDHMKFIGEWVRKETQPAYVFPQTFVRRKLFLALSPALF